MTTTYDRMRVAAKILESSLWPDLVTVAAQLRADADRLEELDKEMDDQYGLLSASLAAGWAETLRGEKS